MRALVKARPEVGLELIERPIPIPGPAEVLVRVTRAAICGTDLHIYKWDDWARKHMTPPVTIGHEFVEVFLEGCFFIFNGGEHASDFTEFGAHAGFDEAKDLAVALCGRQGDIQ